MIHDSKHVSWTVIHRNCQQGFVSNNHILRSMQSIKFGSFNIHFYEANFLFTNRIIYGGNGDRYYIFPCVITRCDMAATIKAGTERDFTIAGRIFALP